MRKIIISILILAVLSACSSDGLVVSGNQKPKYLTVFNKFKETELYQACEEFEDEIREKPSEHNQMVRPSNVRSDMNIVKDNYVDGLYTVEVSCEVRATYSFNAFNHTDEEFEKALGTFSFQY